MITDICCDFLKIVLQMLLLIKVDGSSYLLFQLFKYDYWSQIGLDSLNFTLFATWIIGDKNQIYGENQRHYKILRMCWTLCLLSGKRELAKVRIRFNCDGKSLIIMYNIELNPP